MQHIQNIALILSLLFGSLPIESFAATDREGIWLGTFGKKPLSQSLSFWSEVQLRYSLYTDSMAQTLFRTGILKTVDKNHEFGLLAAYVQTNGVNEFRPTLQHNFQRQSWGNGLTNVRSRFEFRDLEDRGESSLRCRLMIRSQVPAGEEISFVVWEEIFLNMTKEQWTGNRVFERNRLFAGIRIHQENLNFEVGYLNQFVPREVVDISEHLLTVSLFY